MNFSFFHGVRIAGITAVVPAEEILLDDEAEFYDNSLKKVARVKKISGFNKRRIAPQGITASDLCIQAAQTLIKNMNIDRQTIDALIFITQSPDYPVPATCFIQQAALGLKSGCALFDVNHGCAGYVYGLWLASCMIASGACRNVLLLAGDAIFGYLKKANRVLAPVFGDAGSATLVQKDKTAKGLSFAIQNDGNGYETIIRPGGGLRLPHLPEDSSGKYEEIITDSSGNPWSAGGIGNTFMNGKAIFDFTMNTVPLHIQKHLEHDGISQDMLDYLILHQANRQIVENIAFQTGFAPQKAPWETLAKYGNQSCASIPCVICDQLQKSLNFGNKLSLMLCGYGIGLACASCLCDLKAWCGGIADYKPEKPQKSRNELIEYWHNKFRGE